MIDPTTDPYVADSAWQDSDDPVLLARWQAYVDDPQAYYDRAERILAERAVMLSSAWHAGWMAGGNDARRPVKDSPITPNPFVLPPRIHSRADLERAVREAIARGVDGESIAAVQSLIDQFPDLAPDDEPEV